MSQGRLVVMCAIMAATAASCAPWTIEQVRFGWPVETVLAVDSNNRVSDVRYGVTFDVTRIAVEEFNDSTALAGGQVRILRNDEGFYVLTGPRFRHVYVLAWQTGSLTLKTKIEVGKQPLQKPALNQRPPYVELLDGTALRVLLSSNGIVEGTRE